MTRISRILLVIIKEQTPFGKFRITSYIVEQCPVTTKQAAHIQPWELQNYTDMNYRNQKHFNNAWFGKPREDTPLLGELNNGDVSGLFWKMKRGIFNLLNSGKIMAGR